MAPRKKHRGSKRAGGSGVLAGVFAAGVAFLLWSQLLKTSSKITVGDVIPDIPDVGANVFPLDTRTLRDIWN